MLSFGNFKKLYNRKNVVQKYERGLRMKFGLPPVQFNLDVNDVNFDFDMNDNDNANDNINDMDINEIRRLSEEIGRGIREILERNSNPLNTYNFVEILKDILNYVNTKVPNPLQLQKLIELVLNIIYPRMAGACEENPRNQEICSFLRTQKDTYKQSVINQRIFKLMEENRFPTDKITSEEYIIFSNFLMYMMSLIEQVSQSIVLGSMRLSLPSSRINRRGEELIKPSDPRMKVLIKLSKMYELLNLSVETLYESKRFFSENAFLPSVNGIRAIKDIMISTRVKNDFCDVLNIQGGWESIGNILTEGIVKYKITYQFPLCTKECARNECRCIGYTFSKDEEQKIMDFSNRILLFYHNGQKLMISFFTVSNEIDRNGTKNIKIVVFGFKIECSPFDIKLLTHVDFRANPLLYRAFLIFLETFYGGVHEINKKIYAYGCLLPESVRDRVVLEKK